MGTKRRTLADAEAVIEDLTTQLAEANKTIKEYESDLLQKDFSIEEMATRITVIKDALGQAIKLMDFQSTERFARIIIDCL